MESTCTGGLVSALRTCLQSVCSYGRYMTRGSRLITDVSIALAKVKDALNYVCFTWISQYLLHPQRYNPGRSI